MKLQGNNRSDDEVIEGDVTEDGGGWCVSGGVTEDGGEVIEGSVTEDGEG